MTRFLICDQDAWSGMHEPRAYLVCSLRGAPDAQAQTCYCTPTARKMIERPTTRRDWIALGAAITPARRPQHSPDGDAYSVHGLAVHAFVDERRNLTQKRRTGGRYTFWGIRYSRACRGVGSGRVHLSWAPMSRPDLSCHS